MQQKQNKSKTIRTRKTSAECGIDTLPPGHVDEPLPPFLGRMSNEEYDNGYGTDGGQNKGEQDEAESDGRQADL